MTASVADADMGLYRDLQGDQEGYNVNAVGPTALFSATEEEEGTPLDPDAKVFFRKCPWLRKAPVFGKASAAYGPKTTVSLGVTYFLSKGIADQLIKTTMTAMLVTRFGASSTVYQRLKPMASLGWAIKAFTAMFSDGFALCGYTKRWYIAGSAVIGAIFAFVYAALPVKPSSAEVGGAFIFLTSFCKANFDILAEGHYSRLIRRIPKAGSSLVTWIWLLILAGYIVASALSGPLSDKSLPNVCVYIAGALQLITVIFPIFNWYGEKRNRVERAEDARNNYLDEVREHQRLLERERAAAAEAGSDSNSETAVHEALPVVGDNKDYHPENDDVHVEQRDALVDDLTHFHNADGQLTEIDHEALAEEAANNVVPPTPCCCGIFEINKEVMTRDWKLFVYCIIMTLSVLAMMISNILAPRIAIIVICVCVSGLCCGLSFWALPMTIAKANVFIYLHMACYLTIGPLDTFYIATPDCLPDGPHFSFTFYNTVGGIIGNVAGIIGTLGFNYIFYKHSYRMTFMVTCSVQIIASVFDIIIIKRWNVAIGIPDHAMYICGDAIIYQVCYMLSWMPVVILLSRLCPRGSESVVYALLAGFGNLGTSTGSIITSILMEYAWPIASTVPCNYDNLVWLVLVGHFCTPLLIFPLTLLLPKARCCDDLDVDGKAIRSEIKKKRVKDTDQKKPGAEDSHPINEKLADEHVVRGEAFAEPYAELVEEENERHRQSSDNS